MEPKCSLLCSEGPSHWSLSWARWIKSTPSHPISQSSILILFSHLCIGLPSGLFPLGFPTKILHTFLISHACYTPHPSHPLWFDHLNSIWWSIHVIKLLIMQSSPASCHSLIDPNILLRTCSQNTLSLYSSLDVRDQVSHPHKTSKIMVFYILIFKFLERRWEDRRLWKEW